MFVHRTYYRDTYIRGLPETVQSFLNADEQNKLSGSIALWCVSDAVVRSHCLTVIFLFSAIDLDTRLEARDRQEVRRVSRFSFLCRLLSARFSRPLSIFLLILPSC